MKTTQTGLTVVELLVTMAVAIILLVVGMPFFGGLVGSNRATSDANALVAAIQLARSEAVKRGVDTYVCTSTSAATLATNCAGGTSDWEAGWFVFVDTDGDGALDAPGEVVRQWPNGTATGVTALDEDGNARTGGVHFAPDGGIRPDDEPWRFELENSDAGGETSRCVMVNVTGQVRSERGECE